MKSASDRRSDAPRLRQERGGRNAFAGRGGADPGGRGSLVSTVFGGTYEREYRKAVLDPFERETGIKVLAKLGVTSESVNQCTGEPLAVPRSTFCFPYPDNIKVAAEGIAMPLTVQDIPNMKDVDAIWYDQFHGMGVAFYVGYGIAYRRRSGPRASHRMEGPVGTRRSKTKSRFRISAAGARGKCWSSRLPQWRQRGQHGPAFPALQKLKPNVRQFLRAGPSRPVARQWRGLGVRGDDEYRALRFDRRRQAGEIHLPD